MIGRAWLVWVVLAAATPARAADPVVDFYRDRTIFLQIGSESGGIYDIVGRLVARHMAKHFPGPPKIVAQNVPGGGSLALANQFGNVAVRDGTVFGVFNNGMPTTPLLNPQAAHYDPRRFNFIGSTSREAHILVVWRTAPVQTLDALFTKELIVGATSPGAAPYDFPLLTNALIGTRFKIVKGYAGGGETQLAMRRGEIHGNAGLALGSYKADYIDAIRSGDVHIVAAFGMVKNRELQDVPLFPLGKADDRQLFELMYARQFYGRPFATPPGVPAERLAVLRQAFEATLRDADFLAEAARAYVDIDPVAGEELTELTQRLYQTPPALLARMQAVLASAK